MDGYDRILVPVDGSEPSRRAFDRAIAMSKNLGGHITLLNVVRSRGVGMGPMGHEGPILEGEQTPIEARVTSRQMLDDLEKKARSEGVEVTTMIRTGNPGPEIVDISRDYDLIVMGAHGKHLEHILVGSVADKVVHHACCPVMIVRNKLCP
jgi:nucleotide-binding universal stress UspA family protein